MIRNIYDRWFLNCSFFFSGYVMSHCSTSKDSKVYFSGNLLFFFCCCRCAVCGLSCLQKIYLCICVSVEFQTLGCDESTYANLLFGVRPCSPEYFTLEKTCLNVNKARCEWLKSVQRIPNDEHVVWQHWISYPKSESQSNWMFILVLWDSLYVHIHIKFLWHIVKTCESKSIDVSKGHFLPVLLLFCSVLSCPYCPD